MQQNLLLFYFSKAQTNSRKKIWKLRIGPKRPGLTGFSIYQANEGEEVGSAAVSVTWIMNWEREFFLECCNMQSSKCPRLLLGDGIWGLDLWQNLRRFVFQWSLWPQAGMAQLQLLDLGISNAGTFWPTFFLGTFPLPEGSSTTTVACGKWSVSMLELRTPGKFRYLLMFSSLVFLINRCINTWQSWLSSV